MVDSPLINNKYQCNICNKKYASYKSMWNHTTKFHNNKISNENHIISIKEINNVEILESNNKEYNCRYCKKIYNHINSRWAHEKKCKIISEKKEEEEEKKQKKKKKEKI